MEQLLVVSLLVVGTWAFSLNEKKTSAILSAEDQRTAAGLSRNDYLPAAAEPQTKSEFKEVETIVKQDLAYATRYEDAPEIEWGVSETKQAGRPGERQEVYVISYWYGKETGRKKIKNEITREPQEEIIRRGIKKTLKTGDFPGCGQVTYYGRLKVWATSYDKYCQGCLGVTYTGLPAGYGTVAVDPKVIPLYSRICIPGYGVAMAGDIGGAIKGNKIDLGFDDVRTGWWNARWTEIYLLP